MREFELTGTGEQLSLVAEAVGEALAVGVNAFTESYYGKPSMLLEGCVVEAISEILKTQIVRPDCVKTIAKAKVSKEI